jgi:hypothetical protein
VLLDLGVGNERRQKRLLRTRWFEIAVVWLGPVYEQIFEPNCNCQRWQKELNLPIAFFLEWIVA